MMNSIINVITTVLLLFWPMLFMASPMMFAGPGSAGNKSLMFGVIIVLYYPSFIFLIYHFVGWNYLFGISGKTLFIISFVGITLGFMFLGFFSLFSNTMRGISTTGYSVSENKIYYSEEQILKADIETFKELDKRYYAIDKSNVYYKGKVLKDVNPKNFYQVKIKGEDYESDYWSDGHHIFYFGELLVNPNIKDFTPVAGDRAEDKKSHYLGAAKMPVDYESFKWLTYNYYGHFSRDKNGLYASEHPILVQIDMDSFEMTDKDQKFAKDKYRVYLLMGRHTRVIEGADVKTFKRAFIGNHRGYYIDKNRVYYFNTQDSGDVLNGPLKGVNVSTFKVTGYDNETGTDANDGTLYFINGKQK